MYRSAGIFGNFDPFGQPFFSTWNSQFFDHFFHGFDDHPPHNPRVDNETNSGASDDDEGYYYEFSTNTWKPKNGSLPNPSWYSILTSQGIFCSEDFKKWVRRHHPDKSNSEGFEELESSVIALVVETYKVNRVELDRIFILNTTGENSDSILMS